MRETLFFPNAIFPLFCLNCVTILAMEPYQIILLIVLLLAFLYVAVLLYVISNVREFAKRLKWRERALMILLSEKADILAEVFQLYQNAKVEFTSEDLSAFNGVKALRFEKIGKDRVKNTMTAIHHCHSRFNFILQNNKWLQADLSLARLNDIYYEIDRNFRQSSSIYNADVAGYMYWINVPFTRIGVFLLGFRKKTTLN